MYRLAIERKTNRWNCFSLEYG